MYCYVWRQVRCLKILKLIYRIQFLYHKAEISSTDEFAMNMKAENTACRLLETKSSTSSASCTYLLPAMKNSTLPAKKMFQCLKVIQALSQHSVSMFGLEEGLEKLSVEGGRGGQDPFQPFSYVSLKRNISRRL